MRAILKDVFRENAKNLAGLAVGSLVAAVGLEYFYRDNTLAAAFSKWVFFFFFAALGLLFMGAVKLWESRREEEDAVAPNTNKGLTLSSKIQIAAVAVLVLLFVLY